MRYRPSRIDLYGSLPPYFQEILEFQHIMNTEQIELEEFRVAYNLAYDNLFVATADEETLRYHEELLQLAVDLDSTLEERRTRILQRYQLTIPYTLPLFKEYLNMFLGIGQWQLEVDVSNYTINLSIFSVNQTDILNTRLLINEMVPAHLYVLIIIDQGSPQETDIYYGSRILQTLFFHLVAEYTLPDVKFNVTYYPNDSTPMDDDENPRFPATGETIDPESPHSFNSEVTLVENGYDRGDEFDFVGWVVNISPSRTYQPGETFIMPYRDVIVYALWRWYPPSEFIYHQGYYITWEYDEEYDMWYVADIEPIEVTGETIDPNSPYESRPIGIDEETGEEIFATTQLVENGFVRDGYDFVGWTVNSDGTGRSYPVGTEFEVRYSRTWYAQWKKHEFTVTYDKNSDDATGELIDPNSPYEWGEEVYTLESTFERAGYRVVGYRLSQDELDPIIGIGETFIMPQNDVVLYAVWVQDVTYPLYTKTNDISYDLALPPIQVTDITVSADQQPISSTYNGAVALETFKSTTGLNYLAVLRTDRTIDSTLNAGGFDLYNVNGTTLYRVSGEQGTNYSGTNYRGMSVEKSYSTNLTVAITMSGYIRFMSVGSTGEFVYYNHTVAGAEILNVEFLYTKSHVAIVYYNTYADNFDVSIYGYTFGSNGRITLSSTRSTIGINSLRNGVTPALKATKDGYFLVSAGNQLVYLYVSDTSSVTRIDTINLSNYIRNICYLDKLGIAIVMCSPRVDTDNILSQSCTHYTIKLTDTGMELLSTLTYSQYVYNQIQNVAAVINDYNIYFFGSNLQTYYYSISASGEFTPIRSVVNRLSGNFGFTADDEYIYQIYGLNLTGTNNNIDYYPNYVAQLPYTATQTESPNTVRSSVSTTSISTDGQWMAVCGEWRGSPPLKILKRTSTGFTQVIPFDDISYPKYPTQFDVNLSPNGRWLYLGTNVGNYLFKRISDGHDDYHYELVEIYTFPYVSETHIPYAKFSPNMLFKIASYRNDLEYYPEQMDVLDINQDIWGQIYRTEGTNYPYYSLIDTSSFGWWRNGGNSSGLIDGIVLTMNNNNYNVQSTTLPDTNYRLGYPYTGEISNYYYGNQIIYNYASPLKVFGRRADNMYEMSIFDLNWDISEDIQNFTQLHYGNYFLALTRVITQKFVLIHEDTYDVVQSDLIIDEYPTLGYGHLNHVDITKNGELLILASDNTPYITTYKNNIQDDDIRFEQLITRSDIASELDRAKIQMSLDNSYVSLNIIKGEDSFILSNPMLLHINKFNRRIDWFVTSGVAEPRQYVLSNDNNGVIVTGSTNTTFPINNVGILYDPSSTVGSYQNFSMFYAADVLLSESFTDLLRCISIRGTNEYAICTYSGLDSRGNISIWKPDGSTSGTYVTILAPISPTTFQDIETSLDGKYIYLATGNGLQINFTVYERTTTGSYTVAGQRFFGANSGICKKIIPLGHTGRVAALLSNGSIQIVSNDPYDDSLDIIAPLNANACDFDKSFSSLWYTDGTANQIKRLHFDSDFNPTTTATFTVDGIAEVVKDISLSCDNRYLAVCNYEYVVNEMHTVSVYRMFNELNQSFTQ